MLLLRLNAEHVAVTTAKSLCDSQSSCSAALDVKMNAYLVPPSSTEVHVLKEKVGQVDS